MQTNIASFTTKLVNGSLYNFPLTEDNSHYYVAHIITKKVGMLSLSIFLSIAIFEAITGSSEDSLVKTYHISSISGSLSIASALLLPLLKQQQIELYLSLHINKAEQVNHPFSKQN